MKRLSLEELSGDRKNNIDFLRFFFASLVIFDHSFLVLNIYLQEPLSLASHNQTNCGILAVDAFFVLSGFLITASWLRSRDSCDYLKKRILRLYPGLIVLSLFCIFIVGPLGADSVSAYFHSLNFRHYVGSILELSIPSLPGVFAHLPFPNAVDNSLWTLLYEFDCYLMVAIFGILGAYRKRGIILSLFLGVCLAHILQTYHLLPILPNRHFGFLGVLVNWPRFLTYYLAGMVFYLYRDVIPHSRNLAILSIAVLLLAGRVGGLEVVLPLLGAYLLLYISFARSVPMQNFGRRGDFSYGVYIYAFPIQQLLVQYISPHLNPYTLSCYAFAATLLMAVISWRLVEKPFLELKRRNMSPSSPVKPAIANSSPLSRLMGKCLSGYQEKFLLKIKPSKE